MQVTTEKISTASDRRALSTRSASSPAQSSDVTRALQEEVQQIDEKAAFSLKSLAREIQHLRTRLTTPDSNVQEHRQELKSLRKYLKEANGFLHSTQTLVSRISHRPQGRLGWPLFHLEEMALMLEGVSQSRERQDRTVRFIGSLVFGQSLQNDYPAGSTEVRRSEPSFRVNELKKEK